jgi:opacity protein-like surface antigen
MPFHRPVLIPGMVLLALLAQAAPARADATLFLGVTPTPENRAARGFAVGFGLLVLGFEFEYANTVEDLAEAAPSLATGMGNVLLQTPGIGGVQLYGTAGAGLYREQLAAHSETSVGLNTGGGVKVRLAGPLRIRLDYRAFRLQGDPLHKTYQRVYAGVNLAF